MATVDPAKNVRRRSTAELWRDSAIGEGPTRYEAQIQRAAFVLRQSLWKSQ